MTFPRSYICLRVDLSSSGKESPTSHNVWQGEDKSVMHKVLASAAAGVVAYAFAGVLHLAIASIGVASNLLQTQQNIWIDTTLRELANTKVRRCSDIISMLTRMSKIPSSL